MGANVGTLEHCLHFTRAAEIVAEEGPVKPMSSSEGGQMLEHRNTACTSHHAPGGWKAFGAPLIAPIFALQSGQVEEGPLKHREQPVICPLEQL